MSSVVRHSGPSGDPPAPKISEARRQADETARHTWVRELLGLASRSNLLYLRGSEADTGHFQLNLVLLHVIEDQFKLKLQPEEILAEFTGDEDEGTVLDIKGLCGKIIGAMAEARGFEIRLGVTLGNFTFQKMAMVK